MSMPPPPPPSGPPPPPPGWQPGFPEVPPPGGPRGPYPAQPPMYYQYLPAQRTSGLAIASMVLGIVWIYWIGSILAVIFGHIANSQTRKDGTLRGRGMAIAGVVLGYVGLGVLALIIVFAVAASTSNSS